FSSAVLFSFALLCFVCLLFSAGIYKIFTAHPLKHSHRFGHLMTKRQSTVGSLRPLIGGNYFPTPNAPQQKRWPSFDTPSATSTAVATTSTKPQQQ
ncbi:hypothetical protein M5D96_002040, partial [Drosophila gunungcola]